MKIKDGYYINFRDKRTKKDKFEVVHIQNEVLVWGISVCNGKAHAFGFQVMPHSFVMLNLQRLIKLGRARKAKDSEVFLAKLLPLRKN